MLHVCTSTTGTPRYVWVCMCTYTMYCIIMYMYILYVWPHVCMYHVNEVWSMNEYVHMNVPGYTYTRTTYHPTTCTCVTVPLYSPVYYTIQYNITYMNDCGTCTAVYYTLHVVCGYPCTCMWSFICMSCMYYIHILLLLQFDNILTHPALSMHSFTIIPSFPFTGFIRFFRLQVLFARDQFC